MGDCSTRLTLYLKTDRSCGPFPILRDLTVYLLYLDESGHVDDPSTDFFVLAGFCIFERQTHWLESNIEPVAGRFSPTCPGSLEFHGAPMRAGKDEWKGVRPEDRVQAVVDILSLLADRQLKLKVFASVIEKLGVSADSILKRSFENVAVQFDRYLYKLHIKKDPQRGLVIFDKTSYEKRLQALSQVFKHQGHTTGKLRNFAEVPLFLDSKASRLIQMADLIAYWIFRYFQSSDDRGYRLIEPYFYRHRGECLGLNASITRETADRLRSLPPPKYPFPAPTLRFAPHDTSSAISVSMAMTTPV